MNSYIYNLLVCLIVCLHPMNVKRLNRSGENLVWNLTYDPREGLWMLRITESCAQKLLIFVTFWKSTKRIVISQNIYYCFFQKKMLKETELKTVEWNILNPNLLIIWRLNWWGQVIFNLEIRKRVDQALILISTILKFSAQFKVEVEDRRKVNHILL